MCDNTPAPTLQIVGALSPTALTALAQLLIRAAADDVNEDTEPLPAASTDGVNAVEQETES